MSDQITYELDMSEPSEPRSPRRRYPGLITRRRVAIGLAFAVGVALGVAALDKQQDSNAVHARRTEVSLVGVLGQQIDDRERPAYDVRVYNAGPHPVRLGRAGLIAPGYEDPPADESGKAPNHEVAPGTWASLGAAAGSPICPARPADGELRLTVTVATVNGASRRVDVPMLDGDETLTSNRSSECEAILFPQRAVGVWPETTILEDDATVTATLRIDSWGHHPVDVTLVKPAAGLDIEVLDELPVTVPAGGTTTIDVRVLAAQCHMMVRGGGQLDVTVAFGAETMVHQAWIDLSLSPQLMADQGCDEQE